MSLASVTLECNYCSTELGNQAEDEALKEMLQTHFFQESSGLHQEYEMNITVSGNGDSLQLKLSFKELPREDKGKRMASPRPRSLSSPSPMFFGDSRPGTPVRSLSRSTPVESPRPPEMRESIYEYVTTKLVPSLAEWSKRALDQGTFYDDRVSTTNALSLEECSGDSDSVDCDSEIFPDGLRLDL